MYLNKNIKMYIQLHPISTFIVDIKNNDLYNYVSNVHVSSIYHVLHAISKFLLQTNIFLSLTYVYNCTLVDYLCILT